VEIEHRKTGRPPLLLRVVRARPRLFAPGALGAVVTAACTALTPWKPAARLLVGWDIALALYLALAFQLWLPITSRSASTSWATSTMRWRGLPTRRIFEMGGP